jgi:hypothetical protein
MTLGISVFFFSGLPATVLPEAPPSSSFFFSSTVNASSSMPKSISFTASGLSSLKTVFAAFWAGSAVKRQATI